MRHEIVSVDYYFHYRIIQLGCVLGVRYFQISLNDPIKSVEMHFIEFFVSRKLKFLTFLIARAKGRGHRTQAWRCCHLLAIYTNI